MSGRQQHDENAMLARMIRHEEGRLTADSKLGAARIQAVKDRLAAEKNTILAEFDRTPALAVRRKTTPVKTWGSIGVAALLLIGAGIVLLHNRNGQAIEAKLTYTQGTVKANGVAAAAGTPVAKDQVVTTDAKSFAAIQWGDAAVTVLSQNTKIRIVKIEKSALPVVAIENQGGLAFSKVAKDQAHFTVIAPTVVFGVRGTGFSVRATADGAVLSVLEGSVEARFEAKPESPVWVGARQKLTVVRGRAGAQVSALNPAELEQLVRLDRAGSGQANAALTAEIFAGEGSNPAAGADKMTLADIRKKFGKISRVNLKSGASYTGFFVLKGAQMEIVTTRGVVRVPTSQLKDVQDLN